MSKWQSVQRLKMASIMTDLDRSLTQEDIDAIENVCLNLAKTNYDVIKTPVSWQEAEILLKNAASHYKNGYLR